ncbi:MAG: hypothetical protein QG596_1219 [Actinomycetota bacterium]|jgi:hypothetical protein|nr:hypothetical protein [Actinomycetota bacterium]
MPKPKILKRKLKKNSTRSIRQQRRKAANRYRKCRAKMPNVKGDRVHLFNSEAHYYEPAGPVSWDMAMGNTRPDWLVQVRAGDKLELQTTYETDMASWPESMGINIVYWVRDAQLPAAANAPNPYETRVDNQKVLNHPITRRTTITAACLRPMPSTLPTTPTRRVTSGFRVRWVVRQRSKRVTPSPSISRTVTSTRRSGIH